LFKVDSFQKQLYSKLIAKKQNKNKQRESGRDNLEKMAGRFKLPTAASVPRKDPLSQKIPVNPKYKDVRPTIDTGASMTKYLERVKELKANYKYKKGEIFKRIKVTSLVALMIEVSEIHDTTDVEGDESSSTPNTPTTAATQKEEITQNAEEERPVFATPSDFPSRPLTRSSTAASRSLGASSRQLAIFPPSPPPQSSRSKRSTGGSDSFATPYFPHPSSLRMPSESSLPSIAASRPTSSLSSRSTSSLQNLIAGVGEKTKEEDEDKENASSALSSSPALEPPYLLIDIREKDAYDAGHLRTAKHFPTSRLSRAFQFETKELRSFCNKEGKIIVVYDEDESMAPKAATVLVERGYDNVYMLSGGINVAKKFFPDGLVLGGSPSQKPPGDVSAPAASGMRSPVLDAQEVSKLRPYLDEAKLASSPAHRPNTQSFADRRRTQMIGSQFKGKKK